ncbi:MAG: hypothetical protein EPO11_02000 [Gammaproteobacteria bacterium]|nr:MAG: hypothetical protein EPO11_02000 [Gammaproteobacteria bacterium]
MSLSRASNQSQIENEIEQTIKAAADATLHLSKMVSSSSTLIEKKLAEVKHNVLLSNLETLYVKKLKANTNKIQAKVEACLAELAYTKDEVVRLSQLKLFPNTHQREKYQALEQIIQSWAPKEQQIGIPDKNFKKALEETITKFETAYPRKTKTQKMITWLFRDRIASQRKLEEADRFKSLLKEAKTPEEAEKLFDEFKQNNIAIDLLHRKNGASYTHGRKSSFLKALTSASNFFKEQTTNKMLHTKYFQRAKSDNGPASSVTPSISPS